jgi:tetratricopeptide (TPR) repeat protein
LNFLGIALRTLPGESATALNCHQRALALCDKLVAAFADRPQYRMQLVRSHFSLGVVRRLSGRLAEAVQDLQRALDCYRPFSSTSDDAGNRTQFASVHNELAWLLATCADVKFRDPGRAVRLARKAVELVPENGGFRNTLGAAYYRMGNWTEARSALSKSMSLRRGGDSFDWFFLAMIHSQQGERKEARARYEQAVAWMEKNMPRAEELGRFRAEAAELLGVNK